MAKTLVLVFSCFDIGWCSNSNISIYLNMWRGLNMWSVTLHENVLENV